MLMIVMGQIRNALVDIPASSNTLASATGQMQFGGEDAKDMERNKTGQGNLAVP
jgi:hypothetical protein